MSPDDAYSILDAIAEIHDCKDKLKKIEPTELGVLLREYGLM